MRRELDGLLARLERDRTGLPGRMAILAADDVISGCGAQDLQARGHRLLERLNVAAIALVEPALPFADLLIRRAPPDEQVLVPHDSETLTFLHDIPFIRCDDIDADFDDRLTGLLCRRKGVIVEGLGIVATGAVTPEQAYINVSSIFHAVFVKFLVDVISGKQPAAEERAALENMRQNWLKALDKPAQDVPTAAKLSGPASIVAEIARVGRRTVELGLVDSFFGNISCRCGDTIYISQTAASLDDLEGCIDPVPGDNSSTCGITASSELPAHRRVYELTGAVTLLHGHPKFAVALSMLCEQSDCDISDCWKDCPHVRQVGPFPVVAGESGVGGIADGLAPVIGREGAAIVYGHGVFAIGRNGFEDALNSLIETEQWCRHEYFRRLKQTVD